MPVSDNPTVLNQQTIHLVERDGGHLKVGKGDVSNEYVHIVVPVNACNNVWDSVSIKVILATNNKQQQP
jgi:hypothetical protein